MYPPQPPQGPDQGGHDPYQQNPYGNLDPQGPTAYPGASPQSDKMPGMAITVRVLMFIGGAFGLLFGGLLLLAVLGLLADPETTQEVLREVQDSGLYIDAAELTVLFGAMGGVLFGYGVISTALASFMGKRSAVVLWLIVVFQVLASLTLMLGIAFGGTLSVIPLLFAIAMIVLMLLPPTRAFYTSEPTTPYTGY
ncbi:hypothetical protein [Nocardiopsis valliformis]|uniref:hypothetical protein n=1 Tax=Nocardiopsis valliformis TaxID=239974 RepID=UPI00034816D8|nr:hypothetical protein [Nocardiopsis valliformis]